MIVELPPDVRAVGSNVDMMGAGDILLSAYVRTRADGRLPPDALADAVETVSRALRRRAVADSGIVALCAARHWGAGFPEDAPVVAAIRRALPHIGSLAAHTDDIDPASLVASCWVLLARGWPQDPDMAEAELLCAAASLAHSTAYS